MSTFLAEKRNKNKTVLDWPALEAAVVEQRRLTRTTPLSERVLAMATNRCADGDTCVPCAQLDERLIAVARTNCIELIWAHTPPGRDALSSTVLEQQRAMVNPGGGGTTCYKVCQSARGMFRNRWLPFNASDRETHSRQRHWQFAYGSGGMYRRGMGPVLAGIGPDVLNDTTPTVLAKLAAAAHVSDEWRAAAHKLVEALAGWSDTFSDTRVRFEAEGCFAPAESGRFVAIQLRPHRSFYRQGSTLMVAYCLGVRLRLPAAATESGYHQLVNDLSICVIPQPDDLGFGPKAMYALLRAQPTVHGTSEAWPEVDAPPRLITTSLPEVLNVAREFSASGVCIPA